MVGNRAVTAAISSASVPLQRYTEVKRGDARYPTRWKHRSFLPERRLGTDEKFFTHQEKREGSFYAENAQLRPNLVRSSDVDLLVAANLDLAIESTTGEPKTFFATAKRVEEGNVALKGEVSLRQTDRYLTVTGDDVEKKLFEVEPVVVAKKQRGLGVTTPQRCNEMAGLLTGKAGLDISAAQQAPPLVARVLDRVTGEEWEKEHAYRLKAFHHDSDAPRLYLRFLDAMITEFQRILSDDGRNGRKMEAELRKLSMNASLDPALGSAITTYGMATAEQEAAFRRHGERVFEFHFGTVVAKSGPDYITMENYARGEDRSKTTMSGKDPLFFFRMYGQAEPGQTWHERQLGTGSFRGAVISFQVQ